MSKEMYFFLEGGGGGGSSECTLNLMNEGSLLII